MRLRDGLIADVSVLRSLLRGMPRQGSHAQKLDAFYAPQAGRYDRFRERLLQGRRELIEGLDLPDRAVIADLGGGTGRNFEFFGARAAHIARYHVVDLCRPLLDQARARALRMPQLRVVYADAAQWQPDEAVDIVLLSYALTMMPAWREVIANAQRMLKPGGRIAVVDFHVSSAQTVAGRVQHGWLTRRFWPTWFGHDGVRLDDGPLSLLCESFPRYQLAEGSAKVPYLPVLRVPYYRFLGRAQ